LLSVKEGKSPASGERVYSASGVDFTSREKETSDLTYDRKDNNGGGGGEERDIGQRQLGRVGRGRKPEPAGSPALPDRRQKGKHLNSGWGCRCRKSQTTISSTGKRWK